MLKLLHLRATGLGRRGLLGDHRLPEDGERAMTTIHALARRCLGSAGLYAAALLKPRTLASRTTTGMRVVRPWVLLVTGLVTGAPLSLAATIHDFDGDGKADILWRHTSGTLAVWLIDGMGVIRAGVPGGASTDWTVVGVGDFNGDRNADVLWRNTSGTLALWFMNGTSVIGTCVPGGAGADWTVIGVGDFKGGGGTADILWRHTSGTLAVWLMNGCSVIGSGVPGGAANDWLVVGVGDFDGDGKADILWRHASGTLALWMMDGTHVKSTCVPGPGGAAPDWAVAGVGDFNGDSKADILWRHTSGTVAMWLMNDCSVIGVGVPGRAAHDWAIVGVGDLDGNGRADIVWRHNSGTVAAWLMDGVRVTSTGVTGGAANDWRISPFTSALTILKGVGLNVSPYINDQDPNLGSIVTEAQMIERLTRVAPYTEWVRFFGSTLGLERGPRLARAMGLKVACGAWIGKSASANNQEVANLIANTKAGYCDLAIVGSEVLLRADQTAQALLGYLAQVKQAAPAVPVTTADVYGQLLANPQVVAAVDVLMPNYYPFWEGVELRYAVASIHANHQRVIAAAGGKPIVVSETGWPSCGKQQESLIPTARGPILVLGRPQLYPEKFRERLQDELRSVKRNLFERFVMPYPDDAAEADGAVPGRPGSDDQSRFWTVDDTYFKLSRDVAGRQGTHDYGIVRKVRGAFARRTLVFAYGTSSLGTIGAAQMLVDEDQNERLVQLDVDGHFRRHGEVEMLVEVRRPAGDSLGAPRYHEQYRSELTPSELQVAVRPAAPVSRAARDWIAQFVGPVDPDQALAGLYRTVAGETEPGVTRFKLARQAAQPADTVSVQLVGGELIQGCLETLQHLAVQPRTPVLLVGPTGTGKELAARFIYEMRAKRLMEELAHERSRRPPAMVGARWVATNCAAITATLADSLLFGIRDGAGTDVVASPGFILSAGEGVVLLDELSFMNLMSQGRLLRSMQPPFAVTPVGLVDGIPASARIVAATSQDPNELVGENRMLPELVGRFASAVVRLPALAERPGDIPALLATLAEQPVSMDEHVLRCLLADPHPLNVRGLHAIVGDARRLRGDRVPVDGALLEIPLEALGTSAELVRHFARMTDDVPANGVEPRRFVFEPPPRQLLGFETFTDAARVLTSLARGTKDLPFMYRPASHALRQLQAKSRPRGAAPDTWNQGNKGERVAVLFDIWLDMLAGLSATPGWEEALTILGTLSKKRFPEVRTRQALTKALLDRLAVRTDLVGGPGLREHERVYQTDISLSMGIAKESGSRL